MLTHSGEIGATSRKKEKECQNEGWRKSLAFGTKVDFSASGREKIAGKLKKTGKTHVRKI